MNSLKPILYTERLEETIGFYTDVLGFECTDYERSRKSAKLRLGNIEILISHPGSRMLFYRPFFTGSFYFDTDRVNTLWEQLQSKAKVVYPIENYDYGMREFGIEDNNGYTFLFGQQTRKSL